MEQGNEAKTAGRGMAYWLKDARGVLSGARVFTLLLVLTLGAALIASAAGTGVWVTAVLMAILSAVLAHALIIAPLANDYEARALSKPRSTTSTVDSLTHIPNRRGITSSLLDAMAYANRYNHPLTVGLVDLDLLSTINDQMGRRAGDKALQAVAAVFADTLRMPDRAGRYGEEEFLAILPNTTIKNAIKIAERIRDGVEGAKVSAGGKAIPVTVSIGVSQFRKGEDLERFLSRVNKALDQAKTSGRNRVVTDRPAKAASEKSPPRPSE